MKQFLIIANMAWCDCAVMTSTLKSIYGSYNFDWQKASTVLKFSSTDIIILADWGMYYHNWSKCYYYIFYYSVQFNIKSKASFQTVA